MRARRAPRGTAATLETQDAWAREPPYARGFSPATGFGGSARTERTGRPQSGCSPLIPAAVRALAHPVSDQRLESIGPATPGTTVGAERRLCRTSAKTRQLRFRIRAGRTTDCRACRSGRGFAPRFGNRAKLGRGRLTDVLAACPLRSVELELPKHDAADLAGERLGQVGDELDAPRVGIS